MQCVPGPFPGIKSLERLAQQSLSSSHEVCLPSVPNRHDVGGDLYLHTAYFLGLLKNILIWVITDTEFEVQVTVHRDTFLMFRTVPSWCCSQAVRKPVWHVALLCVQWKTPYDGQKNCPRHVEFYSKNKLKEIVRLVDFIIRNWYWLCSFLTETENYVPSSSVH